MRSLALGGRTIMCTIHQPSAKLFEMFDKVGSEPEINQCVANVKRGFQWWSSSTAVHSQSGSVHLQRLGALPDPLSEEFGSLLSHLPQSRRLWYASHIYSSVSCSLLRMIKKCFLFFSLSVIEVASGEYGDLNPMLFEAVQHGMCAVEKKKNQCDDNDISVCETTDPMVSVSCVITRDVP